MFVVKELQKVIAVIIRNKTLFQKECHLLENYNFLCQFYNQHEAAFTPLHSSPPSTFPTKIAQFYRGEQEENSKKGVMLSF